MNGENNPQPNTSQPPADAHPPAPVQTEDETVLGKQEKEPSRECVDRTVNAPFHKTRTVELVQTGVNGILAVIGVFAIWIYGSQLNVMKGQLSLTRQQVVAQYSAVVWFRVDPPARNLINVYFLNAGEGISPISHVNFQISVTNFPDGDVLSKSQVYERTVYQMRKGDNGPIGSFYVPFIEDSDLQYLTQKRTVHIEGTYTYDNGFGDEKTIPICQSFLGRYTIYNPDGSSGGNNPQFLDCSDTTSRLAILAKEQLRPPKKRPQANQK